MQLPSSKYYVSLCCTDVELAPLPKTNNTIGINLGIRDINAANNILAQGLSA